MRCLARILSRVARITLCGCAVGCSSAESSRSEPAAPPKSTTPITATVLLPPVIRAQEPFSATVTLTNASGEDVMLAWLMLPSTVVYSISVSQGLGLEGWVVGSGGGSLDEEWQCRDAEWFKLPPNGHVSMHTNVTDLQDLEAGEARLQFTFRAMVRESTDCATVRIVRSTTATISVRVAGK